MELKADIPYPSLENVGEDCRALRIVSPAYAGREGELTAILQYVYQSVLTGACGEEELSRLLISIAVNEMRHVEILGTLITKLGAPPVFTACPPYPVGFYSASCVNYVRSPEGMLAADIQGEKQAIACYKRMLRELCNPCVSEVIGRIVKDEEVHLAALERAYKKRFS